MPNVLIAPQWVGDPANTEPVSDGYAMYRPSGVITSGGSQWVVPRWSDPVDLGTSGATVWMDASPDVPWEVRVVVPDGEGGDLTIDELRIVTDSGSTVRWETFTQVGGPGSESGGGSALEVRVAALEAQYGNVSGGASTLGAITDMTAAARTLNTKTSTATMLTYLGAGTSNLAIGTTSTTAKAGNYQPTAEDISNASTIGRSILKAADQAAVQTIVGASGTGTSSLVIGTTTGTAADGGVVSALSTTVAGKANSNTPTLVNPVVGTQTLSDSSTKAASTAFVQGLTAWAYGIQPRIVWTGIAWPTRATSIPPGYTGAVEYWSPYDSTAPQPTDALVKDLWTSAGTA